MTLHYINDPRTIVLAVSSAVDGFGGFFFLPKKATKSNLNLQAPDFVRILDVHAFKTLRVC